MTAPNPVLRGPPAPDISRTTSTLCRPPPPSRFVPRPPLTGLSHVNPILSANFNRYPETSAAKTLSAADFRTAMPISPIGPHPVTSTVLPATGYVIPWIYGVDRAPQGSCKAAIRGFKLLSFFHAFSSGTATYSAKAPSTSTPRILRFLHMCILPVLH